VTLHFTVHNREGLLAHLAANLTDLAIMARPPADEEMICEPFAPHPFVVIAPPSHPLAGRKRIEMRRLVREPFVVREKGSDTWQSMQEAFGPHLAQLRVALEITSTETLKQAVIAGLGIGYLSAHTVAQELRAKSLVVLDVRGLPRVQRWYVVHRRLKRLPPVAQAFKEFLRAEGAELLARIMAGASEAASKSPRR
jgi:DNA-binding transcriptional LysR family regulator